MRCMKCAHKYVCGGRGRGRWWMWTRRVLGAGIVSLHSFSAFSSRASLPSHPLYLLLRGLEMCA